LAIEHLREIRIAERCCQPAASHPIFSLITMPPSQHLSMLGHRRSFVTGITLHQSIPSSHRTWGLSKVIVVILTRQGHLSSLSHLLLILLEERLVDRGGGGSESRGSNKFLEGESAVNKVEQDDCVDVRGHCFQRACEQATGMASRSYNSTWPKYRSTEGSFSGGM